MGRAGLESWPQGAQRLVGGGGAGGWRSEARGSGKRKGPGCLHSFLHYEVVAVRFQRFKGDNSVQKIVLTVDVFTLLSYKTGSSLFQTLVFGDRYELDACKIPWTCRTGNRYCTTR